MEDNICKNCMYFRQHYVLDERRITRVFCGHCTFSRARSKRPYSKACEHFISTEPDENAFVSKEYLSKVLLQYLISLELLPEIKDLN